MRKPSLVRGRAEESSWTSQRWRTWYAGCSLAPRSQGARGRLDGGTGGSAWAGEEQPFHSSHHNPPRPALPVPRGTLLPLGFPFKLFQLLARLDIIKGVCEALSSPEPRGYIKGFTSCLNLGYVFIRDGARLRRCSSKFRRHVQHLGPLCHPRRATDLFLGGLCKISRNFSMTEATKYEMPHLWSLFTSTLGCCIAF